MDADGISSLCRALVITTSRTISFSVTELSGAFGYFCASPSAYRGQYPIPINFNDERGQFNTYRSHCSKLVGNKSYPLVTEKCMAQISTYVIWYTLPIWFRSRPLATCLCVIDWAVKERDTILKYDRYGQQLRFEIKEIIDRTYCRFFVFCLFICSFYLYLSGSFKSRAIPCRYSKNSRFSQLFQVFHMSDNAGFIFF